MSDFGNLTKTETREEPEHARALNCYIKTEISSIRNLNKNPGISAGVDGSRGEKGYLRSTQNSLTEYNEDTDDVKEDSYLKKKESINAFPKIEKTVSSKVKSKYTIRNFLQCPLIYHTNFIGTFLFIIGSVFFIYPLLVVSGCILFTIACVCCLYSNFIGAKNLCKERNCEFWGFFLYAIGCIIFIGGSIYSCFVEDVYAITSFIVGSAFFFLGAIAFLFSLDIKQLSSIDYKIIIVFASNFTGGALFTWGSVCFLYEDLYLVGCSLFVVGSVLFTIATFFDYIIYIKDHK